MNFVWCGAHVISINWNYDHWRQRKKNVKSDDRCIMIVYRCEIAAVKTNVLWNDAIHAVSQSCKKAWYLT